LIHFSNIYINYYYRRFFYKYSSYTILLKNTSLDDEKPPSGGCDTNVFFSFFIARLNKNYFVDK